VQQMREPTPATERSRRRPPRRRADEPIPIPESPPRPRRARTVKLQQVLKAYQRAVLDVVEKRMAGVAEAAARAAREAVAEALEERPRGPDQGDVATGALAFADERFQAMSLRLHHIEEAVRALAGGRPTPSERARSTDAEVLRRLDEVAEALAGLAVDHRAVAEELGRRTGGGVVAVGRVLREDLRGLGEDLARLREGIDGVRTSVGSMHRTLAWEGMRTARPRPGPAGST
jgi:hypothetical protein